MTDLLVRGGTVVTATGSFPADVAVESGRIHEIVEAVWGVDLVEAHLRSCLGLPPNLSSSRRARASVVNTILHASGPGRLERLTFPASRPAGCLSLEIDIETEIGSEVVGPEAIFSTVLADITLTGKNLKRARALTAELLIEPPRIVPIQRAGL